MNGLLSKLLTLNLKTLVPVKLFDFLGKANDVLQLLLAVGVQANHRLEVILCWVSRSFKPWWREQEINVRGGIVASVATGAAHGFLVTFVIQRMHISACQ